MASKLSQLFPHAKFPFICNAPMAGIATPQLAAEVTKAGGIGFDGCSVDISPGSSELEKLDARLTTVRDLVGPDIANATPRLPVGIGFLTGHASIDAFTETITPIVVKHRPAAVWLFAPQEHSTAHRTIIQALKALEVPPAVFVQIGSLQHAREAVQDGADVIVCQGIDAGGHQLVKNVGVVSLVPMVREMLKDEFTDRDITLLGAGGIVTGDGVAAVTALGASGAVMGTRFSVSDESAWPAHRKQAVIAAKDGGAETVKSTFNDQIVNSTIWGTLHDGRAIIGPIHEKFMAGASLAECQEALKSDYSADEAKKIVNNWAGTGVGLVNKAQPAGEIVREVHGEAIESIKRLAGMI